LKRTLQQAAGNLPREEFYLFSDSLANPAASCGECAHFHGSSISSKIKSPVCIARNQTAAIPLKYKFIECLNFI
jgi:hypothetical protein